MLFLDPNVPLDKRYDNSETVLEADLSRFSDQLLKIVSVKADVQREAYQCLPRTLLENAHFIVEMFPGGTNKIVKSRDDSIQR